MGWLCCLSSEAENGYGNNPSRCPRQAIHIRTAWTMARLEGRDVEVAPRHPHVSHVVRVSLRKVPHQGRTQMPRLSNRFGLPQCMLRRSATVIQRRQPCAAHTKRASRNSIRRLAHTHSPRQQDCTCSSLLPQPHSPVPRSKLHLERSRLLPSKSSHLQVRQSVTCRKVSAAERQTPLSNPNSVWQLSPRVKSKVFTCRELVQDMRRRSGASQRRLPASLPAARSAVCASLLLAHQMACCPAGTQSGFSLGTGSGPVEGGRWAAAAVGSKARQPGRSWRSRARAAAQHRPASHPALPHISHSTHSTARHRAQAVMHAPVLPSPPLPSPPPPESGSAGSGEGVGEGLPLSRFFMTTAMVTDRPTAAQTCKGGRYGCSR